MTKQEEINDAVMLILQNTEDMTTDALDRVSFAVWCELQDRGMEEQ